MEVSRTEPTEYPPDSPLCPDCGAKQIRIQTSVFIDYEVAVGGDLDNLRVISDLIGDAMWDETSRTTCPGCGWEGKVADLLVAGTKGR